MDDVVATNPICDVTAAKADRIVIGSNFTNLPIRPRDSGEPKMLTAALSARKKRSNNPRSAVRATSAACAKLVPDSA